MNTSGFQVFTLRQIDLEGFKFEWDQFHTKFQNIKKTKEEWSIKYLCILTFGACLVSKCQRQKIFIFPCAVFLKLPSKTQFYLRINALKLKIGLKELNTQPLCSGFFSRAGKWYRFHRNYCELSYLDNNEKSILTFQITTCGKAH